METQVQPLSCRLRPGLPASLLTARRPAAVQSNPSTKESCSPPEYGAVAPKNLSRVFHPSEFASAPGSDIKYYWKLALSGCQSSSMFSGLVQALHQFRILTGASSSPGRPRAVMGAAGEKAGWSLPSPELVGWRTRGASMNCAGGAVGKSLDGWRVHAASQRIFASLPLTI